MKPWIGVIHELPLPKVLEIVHLMNHTPIQQRQRSECLLRILKAGDRRIAARGRSGGLAV